MSFCSARPAVLFFLTIAFASAGLNGQEHPPSSSSAKPAKPVADQTLDPGSISNRLYRNKTLEFTCTVPEGWVLRTDDMNAAHDEHDHSAPANDKTESASQNAAQGMAHPASSKGAGVLLAAFSRPPEAHGEEVNASIVIAAEPASNYPGLKEAVQYFGPLSEVAQAQGFTADEDPYEIAIGTKTLVRGDFHRDVGTRVMRQSTLVVLSHGYAVSFTMIAGTEDDVEELIDGLDFQAPPRAGSPK